MIKTAEDTKGLDELRGGSFAFWNFPTTIFFRISIKTLLSNFIPAGNQSISYPHIAKINRLCFLDVFLKFKHARRLFLSFLYLYL